MSNLSNAKILAKKKNWSVDDLAQIIGYVMMGETTSYIADQMYVCELDVREAIQETLPDLSARSFHDHAEKLGFSGKQTNYYSEPNPDYHKLKHVWKPRKYRPVSNPQPKSPGFITASFAGDPPFERCALSIPPKDNSFKALINSVSIAQNPKEENLENV